MKRPPLLGSQIETTPPDERGGWFGRLMDSIDLEGWLGELLSCLLEAMLDLLL